MIHFDFERLNKALLAHEQWWAGTLDRPLVKLTVPDAHPAVPHPVPLLSQRTCADFSHSPEQIIDALDAHLGRCEYLGDAFPMVSFDCFGPGVLAALCGAKLDNSSGSVWFFPDKAREIGEITVQYDPDNRWARRIKDIYRAGLAKWQGLVILGMPDLGGALDVAATFRGTQNLLTDLYDEPEEVLRVIGEIETAWQAAYDDFSEVLRPQGMHTDWSGLLSRAPSYILQSDFTYMIGTDMFRRFALPTLSRNCETLQNTIYHLDGVGQLNHLDDILQIPSLSAVQWVYGDGKPSARYWLDVYKKIEAAGKRMMVVGDWDDFRLVASAVRGVYYSTSAPAAALCEARAKLNV